MTTKLRILAIATIGLLALAVPAMAIGGLGAGHGLGGASSDEPDPDCETLECDGDVIGKNDCAFSSIDAAALAENAGGLVDTDLCIGNSDTFEEKGFWAVASVCLSTWAHDVSEALGIDVVIDVFVSQHGVDLDGSVEAGDSHTDLEDTPVGDLDDATWDVLGDVDEQLHAAGADPHHIVPVGGEDLPTTNADAIAKLDE